MKTESGVNDAVKIKALTHKLMRTYISAYKQFRYYGRMKVYEYMEGMMTKCDFCTESNEKGKCYWEYQSSKREHCEKAIDRMSKALGQDSSSKK